MHSLLLAKYVSCTIGFPCLFELCTDIVENCTCVYCSLTLTFKQRTWDSRRAFAPRALAMAPKIQYDAANMQIQADATAEKEIQIVIQDGVRLPPSAEVSCEYLGVLKDDGFTLDARPTLRSTVGYKWSYRDNENSGRLP